MTMPDAEAHDSDGPDVTENDERGARRLSRLDLIAEVAERVRRRRAGESDDASVDIPWSMGQPA